MSRFVYCRYCCGIAFIVSGLFGFMETAVSAAGVQVPTHLNAKPVRSPASFRFMWLVQTPGFTKGKLASLPIVRYLFKRYLIFLPHLPFLRILLTYAQIQDACCIIIRFRYQRRTITSLGQATYSTSVPLKTVRS